MNPLDLVKLTPLMELTRGKPEIKFGLIDDLNAMKHSNLRSEKFLTLLSSQENVFLIILLCTLIFLNYGIALN